MPKKPTIKWKEWLKEHKIVKDWLNDVSNDITRRNYRYWIKKFFDFIENIEEYETNEFLKMLQNEVQLREMKTLFRSFRTYETARLKEYHEKEIEKSSKGMRRRGDEYSWRQSVNNYLSALKSFFEFLDENDYIKYDPISSQKFVDKVPRETIRKVLTVDDAKRLLDACENMRQKVIINMLWETLGRLNVLQIFQYIHFKKHTKDKRKRHIYIPKTKRNKPLDTDISKETYDLIEKWTIERFEKTIEEMINENPTQFVITTNTKDYSSISPSTIQKDINIIAKNAGFDPILEPIFPHLFRHSSTTELDERVGDESFLQRRGNWSTRKMLDKYSHKRRVKEDSEKMDELFEEGFSLMKEEGV